MHRTPLKVILNPILRRLGWVIVSIIRDEDQAFLGYRLRRWRNGRIV